MTDKTSCNCNPFAALLIRLAIGSYFILLGIWAYTEPELSTQSIKRYADFSTGLSELYVSIGGFLCFAIGVALVVGIFMRTLCVAGIIFILPLLYGAGMFSPQGDSLVYFLEKRSLMRDVVVVAGCLSLILTGPGAFSLERILRGLYGTDK